MKEPKISVIVPVYKVEKYLTHAVDSIINQTYKNLEIILVDDGSPDLCGKICDEYAKKDARIKVIHKENGGLADARNAGIDIAEGDFFGFVDSDDYLAPDMYERLLHNLIENDAQISMCLAYIVYDDDMSFYDIKKGEIKVFSEGEILENLFCGCLNNFAWNKLYKKELFQSIRYPKGKIYEDLFTTYKLFGLCKKVVFDGSKLYYYRIRKDSIMGMARRVIHLDKFEAFYEILNYSKDNKTLLDKAKAYMADDLAADTFKVIAADATDDNSAFFDKVKAFIKDAGLERSKSRTVLVLATRALWLLKLRYRLQKITGRVK